MAVSAALDITFRSWNVRLITYFFLFYTPLRASAIFLYIFTQLNFLGNVSCSTNHSGKTKVQVHFTVITIKQKMFPLSPKQNKKEVSSLKNRPVGSRETGPQCPGAFDFELRVHSFSHFLYICLHSATEITLKTLLFIPE